VPNLGEKKRLLIVESDGFTRLVLIFMFRLAGFAVDFTSNGTLALAKIRASPPDVLLVELKLPVFSGLDLIREARREPQFGSRPVYLFTHTEQMSRAAHKQVPGMVTRVFDKSSTTMESLVSSIVADFSGVPPPQLNSAPESNDTVLIEAPQPDPEPPVPIVPPGNLREIVTGVREQCELWLKSRAAGKPVEGNDELLSRLRYLVSCARAAGLRHLAGHARALEAFLKELTLSDEILSEEDISTISYAMEALGSLCSGQTAQAGKAAPFTVAVVDESPISGEALSLALLKAGINPVSFPSPAEAVTHLESHPVNLVIANLAAPELHRLDSTQIVQFPRLAATPIIFVPQPVQANGPDWSEPVPPSLNSNPKLVARLVLKALNKLQRPEGPGVPLMSATGARGSAAPKSAAPDSRGPASVNGPASAESMMDFGDVFVRAPAKDTASAVSNTTNAAPDSRDPAPANEPEPAEGSMMDFGDIFVRAPAGAAAGSVPETTKAAPDAQVPTPANEPAPAESIMDFGDIFVRAPAGAAPSAVPETPNAAPDVQVPPPTNEPAPAESMMDFGDIFVRKPAEAVPSAVPETSNAAPEGQGPAPADESAPAHASIQGFEDVFFRAAAEAPLSAVANTIESAPADAVSGAQMANLNTVETNITPNEATILFVENDPAVRQVYTEALAKAGFQVEYAEDGLAAFDALSRIRPVVIIVDLVLPKVSGLQVLQCVRADSHLKDTPVIVLTDTADDYFAARNAGANRGFSKTECTPETLVQYVCALLGQAPPQPAAEPWRFAESAAASDAQAVAGQFAPAPEMSPEAMAAQALGASLASELVPAGESGETPQAQEEIFARLSAGNATERSTDGPYGVVGEGPAPVSETLEEGALQPAAEVSPAETERLIAASRTPAEFASPMPFEHGIGASQNQAAPGFESAALDKLGAGPVPNPSQAEHPWSMAPASESQVAPQSDAGLQQGHDAPMPYEGTTELGHQGDFGQQFETLQGESAKQRDAIARYEIERELLMSRVVSAENNARDEEMLLQRKEETIEGLQRQLQEFESQLRAAESAARAEELEEQSRRATELERQLAEQRQAREAVDAQLAKEQQANAESAKRIKELEEQLQSGKDQAADLQQGIGQRVAALTRVTADLAREKGERKRIEERTAALNNRMQQLHTESRLLLESQRADQERIMELESQLHEREEAFTRQAAEMEQLKADWQLAEEQLDKTSGLHADLSKHLSSFDAARQTLNHAQQDLQTRLDDALNSLQESTSKLQQESAENERLATELEEARRELQNQSRKQGTSETQLQAAVQALHESESKAQQEAAERQRLAAGLDTAQRELQEHRRNRQSLEADLKIASEALRESESKAQQEAAERQRLTAALDAAEREVQDHRRNREMIEADFKAAAEALRDSESRLHQQAAERQRLAQTVETDQLSQRAHSQKADLELSKAQSALQFERVQRERLEAEVAHLQHASIEAARGSRLQRNAWRKQLSEPVDSLYRTANNILQLELSEEHKKLAEAILQNILLVQNQLQEPEEPSGSGAGATSA
jgi:DNA-binding response OmpR family regulator